MHLRMLGSIYDQKNPQNVAFYPKNRFIPGLVTQKVWRLSGGSPTQLIFYCHVAWIVKSRFVSLLHIGGTVFILIVAFILIYDINDNYS